jgi:hypothetical protein
MKRLDYSDLDDPAARAAADIAINGARMLLVPRTTRGAWATVAGSLLASVDRYVYFGVSLPIRERIWYSEHKDDYL